MRIIPVVLFSILENYLFVKPHYTGLPKDINVTSTLQDKEACDNQVFFKGLTHSLTIATAMQLKDLIKIV